MRGKEDGIFFFFRCSPPPLSSSSSSSSHFGTHWQVVGGGGERDMFGVEEGGWMDHPPHPIFFFSSQLGPSDEDAIAASPFLPIPPPKEEGRFGAERKTEEGGRKGEAGFELSSPAFAFF